MNWGEQIFRYCERGLDAGFWAEPVNALSNIAFAVAAAAALWRLVGGDRRAGKSVPLLLIGLVVAMGVGSFGFHTLATRAAHLGDVGPISVFMLAYMGFALRALLALSWAPTLIGVAGFAAAGYVAGTLTCGGVPCLNGTAGYIPGLVGLIVIGAVLARRGSAAGVLMLGAGAILLASMTLRTMDLALCDTVVIAGHRVGTHFAWHLLNALLLYLLLRIAVDHRPAGRQPL